MHELCALVYVCCFFWPWTFETKNWEKELHGQQHVTNIIYELRVTFLIKKNYRPPPRPISLSFSFASQYHVNNWMTDIVFFPFKSWNIKAFIYVLFIFSFMRHKPEVYFLYSLDEIELCVWHKNLPNCLTLLDSYHT